MKRQRPGTGGAKLKRGRGIRKGAKMPAACARRFLKMAVELDAHEQRLRLLEEAVVLLAASAGLPF
jgi:hypothetical protein